MATILPHPATKSWWSCLASDKSEGPNPNLSVDNVGVLRGLCAEALQVDLPNCCIIPVSDVAKREWNRRLYCESAVYLVTEPVCYRAWRKILELMSGSNLQKHSEGDPNPLIARSFNDWDKIFQIQECLELSPWFLASIKYSCQQRGICKRTGSWRIL